MTGLQKAGGRMLHEAAGSGTTPSGPYVDGQESPADRLPTGGPDGPGGAVALERLLSVAVLTPAQACLVAVQLLQAAHRRGGPADEQPAARPLGPVTVTPQGDVHVGLPPLDAGTPVDDPLGRLVHNARRLPAHPRPEQLALLRRLEEAAGDPGLEPGVRAHVLLAALTDTLGTGARERLTRQLAALVAAFAQLAGAAGADQPDVPRQVGPAEAPEAMPPAAARVRHGSEPAARRATPPGHRPGRAPRRGTRLRTPRARARRLGLVALIVLAVLVGGGYAVLRGTGTDVVDALGLGGRPAAPKTSAPAAPSTRPAEQARGRDRNAVPALAARRSGAVTGVTLRKAGSCRPGAMCPVKVTVHVRPASTSRTITWKVGAARLCKRGITWSPRTTVTARPGWTTVYASSSVRVPPGRSLALVALTTAPARAQSRPVPVVGSSLRC